MIDSVGFIDKKFHAVSTFNVCNEDSMNLMAFILPGNENDAGYAPEEEDLGESVEKRGNK